MLGEPKGYIIIDKKLEHTRLPENIATTLMGRESYDIAEDYRNALCLRMVPVIDIAVDGSDYMVLGRGEKSGDFLWCVDKRDTIGELIPYSLLHPEPSPEDVIKMLQRMISGEVTEEDLRVIEEYSKRMGVPLW